MSKKKDGGVAYPSWIEQFIDPSKLYFDKGMSLRDWFAGMAMQGIFLKDTFRGDIAEVAYQIADAMIEEREK